MFLGPYVGSPLVAVNSVCGKVPFGFMSVIYCFVPPSSATCTGMGNTDMKAVCCVICCVIGPIELHSVNFFCLTYVASITPGIIELSIPLPFFSLVLCVCILDQLIQYTALLWMKEFLQLAGRHLLPYTSSMLAAILPCVAYTDDKQRILFFLPSLCVLCIVCVRMYVCVCVRACVRVRLVWLYGLDTHQRLS